MRRFLGAALMMFGAALLAYAGWASLQPPPLPYAVRLSAAPEKLAGFGALERMDILGADDKPLASGLVARDSAGAAFPVEWRNAVTEPVFFADLVPADDAKVLDAIKTHVPAEAVVFAWWDFSRRIRAATGRAAPLDDAAAAGLLVPGAWRAAAARIGADQARFWGAKAPAQKHAEFDAFLDALTLGEAEGAKALRNLAGGKDAYLALRLSDLARASAARRSAFALGVKDFPGAGGPHGTLKAARDFLAEQKIDGGYAVEPLGTATRLHYFLRAADGERLLARLLPFTSSNPLRLENFDLVYQHKDYWIYRLRPAS